MASILLRTGGIACTLSALVMASVGGAALAQTSGFDVLRGSWVRPDGGYTITIKSVDAGGKMDAAYANPNPLPFSKAEATSAGGAIKVFLELTAGGYNGSTYTLTYDPAKKALMGVYYQAVQRQKYDVVFIKSR